MEDKDTAPAADDTATTSAEAANTNSENPTSDATSAEAATSPSPEESTGASPSTDEEKVDSSDEALTTDAPAIAQPVSEDTHAATSAAVGHLVGQLNTVLPSVPADSPFAVLVNEFKDTLSEIEMFIRKEVKKI